MPQSIDPQKIYPKRLGIYRGNLVIEYYNLERDCFRKHLIPYDTSQSVDRVLQAILKNPKHYAFLRKVAPHHIKSAISGRPADILPDNINQRSSSGNYQYTGTNSYPSSYSNTQTHDDRNSSHQSSVQNGTKPEHSAQSKLQLLRDRFKKKDLDESGSYNLSNSKISTTKKGEKLKSEANLEDSHGYSMNFDEESMNISVVPIKEAPEHEHVIEEEMNYDDDFQQLSGDKFEISLEKPKDRVIEKEKSVEKRKEKNEQKSKDKKKKEQLEQFEFLDDEEPKKKKKKKKDKQKSKQKDTKKKQPSQSSSKNTSKQPEKPIEQQFDFI